MRLAPLLLTPTDAVSPALSIRRGRLWLSKGCGQPRTGRLVRASSAAQAAEFEEGCRDVSLFPRYVRGCVQSCSS